MTDSSTRLSAEQKRELLAKLLREKAEREVTPHPLSYGQRALWFLYQLDKYSSAYNLMYAARVRPDLDHDAFGRAFQQLFDRHAVLRTTYGTHEGQPAQFVHGHRDFQWQQIDATQWSAERLEQELNRHADESFDLKEGPVFRVDLFLRDNEWPVLLITAHHIAMDFWSFDILFDELELLYREEVTGQPANLAELPIQFVDYVHWQEGMLAGPEGERLFEAWRETLSGELTPLDLPTDRPRPPLQTFSGRSLHFHLPDELSTKLDQLARSEGATLYATLLAAFQLLLHRYSGQRDILVGSPTAGRNRAELEPVIGYFLNPIVLRAALDPDMTFRQFLGQVRETLLAGLNQQDLPFPLLVERLQPPRDSSRSPVFQVAFGWDKPRRLTDTREARDHDSQSAALPPQDLGTLGLEPFALGQQGAAFDLMLMMLNMGKSLSAALQYNSNLFNEATVLRLIDHFRELLSSMVDDPDQKLAEINLLTGPEKSRQLRDWNATEIAYDREAGLHELFERQVVETPDAVAAMHGDQQLSYGQLNARANQLARHLRTLGVGPDVLVGICVDRSLEMVVGVLGILKAGGAYVPLAPGTPPERLAYMLQQSQAPVLLTQSALKSELPESDQSAARTIVCLDSDWPRMENQSTENLTTADTGVRSDNLAYVIFTSGSTGKPKGVQIEHRTVVNFLTSMADEPGMDAHDTLLAVTTLTFDISVLELFLPLAVGARIVMVDREAASDGRQLVQLLIDSKTTVMQATPATWRLLIEAGWDGDGHLKCLCGGEAMPRDLASQLVERCGSVWNMYGPTETTIWSAVDQVENEPGAVSIGRPIGNTQIYVVDDRMNPVPIGVPGDLFIAGDGLARGYLNRPELTAARFVHDPFSPREGARMYKTGDLARYRSDGRLDFLGRQDFQVKVRGYRIELGDIEANLNEHTGIREAVVVARQLSPRIDDKQLVGYLIAEGDELPNTSELRDFLLERLPDYMVPATYVAMDAFPLNPAGKVDRRALPEPDSSRPELNTEYVAPRDDRETLLAEVWSTVLGLDQVGIRDNFFELGGASIQSLEIADATAQDGYEMTPAMLFQHPTIEQLAAALTLLAPAEGAAIEAELSDAPAQSPVGDEVIEAELVESPILPPQPPRQEAQPEPVAQAEPETPRRTSVRNSVIESLGIYLPPNEVSTKEVLQGCQKPMWFPLERMTGIKARRMAGEDEFSIDLARKAVEECLAHSAYNAEDIDLLICCNITRLDVPDKVSVEPNTSMQLKRHFNLPRAEVFDITNACTGMFTAMSIVDSFINTGAIRRGMVVSGEYITAITKTAQLEISGFLDPRLACLTVGDAGAAVVLEAAGNNDVGFHELDMYSLSKYSRMCIGRLTDQPHGGPIMHVPNPIEHTSVAVEHSVNHAQYLFERSPWSPENLQHLIMHQTSDRSLRDGMRAINKAFKKKICNNTNTVNNIAQRGNTATTSHMVAVWDHILDGRIASGDNVVFGITGSGQTIGTGIYTFDDLPDRIRGSKSGHPIAKAEEARREAPPLKVRNPQVRIRAVGPLPLDQELPTETAEVSALAGNLALERSPYECSEIELLIYAGMLRTGYISEPAIATLVGGEMKMNDIIKSERDKKTFAFDVYNSALGSLQACQVAMRMMQSGKFRTAMVIGCETEVNAEPFPDELLGVQETASAVILEVCEPDARDGFGQFVFDYDLEHFESRTAMGYYRDGRPFCDLQEVPEIDDQYLAAIPASVQRLLALENLDLSQIKAILPPQKSTAFSQRLAQTLGIAADRVVDVPGKTADLFTSSLAYSVDHAQRSGLVQPGDIGLIINVASGIQIGCATYRF